MEGSEAKTKGRTYNEFPIPFFIHSLSIFNNSFKPSKKTFLGISGIANLLDEILNLLKFSSGLNNQIPSLSSL